MVQEEIIMHQIEEIFRLEEILESIDSGKKGWEARKQIRESGIRIYNYPVRCLHLRRGTVALR